MRRRSRISKGVTFAPKGAAWEQAVAYWRTLPTDPGAVYDTERDRWTPERSRRW